MAKQTPRLKVPETALKGEIIEIKTLVIHKMDTGFHKDNETGEIIPQMIINTFLCTFNEEEIFRVDLAPSVSANPYFAFFARVYESGSFEFTWIDDEGTIIKASKAITVK
jgi:sulfur-oxidizing protein SoxZ